MRGRLAYLMIPLLLLGCGLGGALRAEKWAEITPSVLIGLWRGDRGDSIHFADGGEFYADDVGFMVEGLSAASHLGSGKSERVRVLEPATAARGSA